ncbi:hypothetical protein QBC37DRAFT_38348 [Rhypophila decipiens]|uniref:Uncharacterized protein n=1 Tax=Rhypophila decipiens TaxID=261697 RepID=A0AAN7BE22_9PEZI|nr:hypothetical protein QBC37DRAFT_38348 [Rhypophila decipiens]
MNNPPAPGQELLSFPAPLYHPAAPVYQPAAPITAPITNRQTMASTRKYSQEQIRFVLTRWVTHDRSEIVTEFNAHFAGFQLNKKQVKYIKDTYAKHSAWIGEFGHLMTERQRKSAAGQVKTSTPDPNSKENVPLGGTSSPSGFPQPPTSNVVGGGMGNAFQPAATTNTVGLGIMNNAATFPAPGHYAVSQPNRAASRTPSVPQSPAISATATGLGPFVAGNTTMVNQMASPSIGSAASYPNQNPTSAGQGPPGANITPSPVIPPRVSPVQGTQNGNMYAQLPSQAVGVASAQQSFSAGLPPRPPSAASGRGQPFMAAGLSSPALQGTGTARFQQMMPTGSPQLVQTVETPRVQHAASFTSPTKGIQSQGYTPTGTPPGLPSVRMTPRQFGPAFSPSPSRRSSASPANNMAQSNYQQITLPQASMAVPAANMLVGSQLNNVNGSRPPSHIQLPKQDFDQDGVWYNTSHDGCSIQERHRHSNDGGITTMQGLQGATRGTENASQKNVPSPKTSPIAGPKQPMASTGVSTKQTPVTSPWNNQAAHNANLRTQQQNLTPKQMDAIRQFQLQQYREAQQGQQPQPLQQAQVVQPVPQLQHGQLAQKGQRRQSVQQTQPFQQPLQGAQAVQQAQQTQQAQQAQSPQQAKTVQQLQQLQQFQQFQRAQAAHRAQQAQRGQAVQQAQQLRSPQQAQVAQQQQRTQAAIQQVQQAQQPQSPQQAQVAQQQQRTQAIIQQVQQAQQPQSPQQAQVAQQQQRTQATVQQVQQAQQLKSPQQAQQLQSSQQAQAFQPVQQAQQAQAVKPVQQGPVNQPVQQAQHARNVQQLQTAQQARQAQAVKPAQQVRQAQAVKPAQQPRQAQPFNPVQKAQDARNAQALRQYRQYTQAQLALSRATTSQLGQVRTPHQQAALGNSNAQRTNEGLSSPSKSPPATSGTTESALRNYFWDEDTIIDLAPGAFNPPKYLPDGSPNYALYDRLPDIVDGDHCQHEVYDKFPNLPWTSGPDSDMVPVLDPLFVALQHALSEQDNNPRKRRATADDAVSTGTRNATEGGDSERATKKRSVGDGLSVITATVNNGCD